MKHNYKELLDNNLSVNSYLWPNDRNPFEFIETVVKSRIKNIGLHTDFINNFGVNKLKQELTLNKINAQIYQFFNQIYNYIFCYSNICIGYIKSCGI